MAHHFRSSADDVVKVTVRADMAVAFKEAKWALTTVDHRDIGKMARKLNSNRRLDDWKARELLVRSSNNYNVSPQG